MPPGAIYCGRPSPWGNPFVDFELANGTRHVYLTDGASCLECWTAPAGDCVDYYRRYVLGELPELAGRMYLTDRAAELRRRLPELTGRDLLCWCPLEARCHVDVLLELANNDNYGGLRLEPGAPSLRIVA